MSKRKNEELSEESKRQMEEIQPHEVEPTSKPQFFRLDELVHNSGLKHIALQIFSELDPKSHVNCRMVSKGWKDCIDYFQVFKLMSPHMWSALKSRGIDEFKTAIKIR